MKHIFIQFSSFLFSLVSNKSRMDDTLKIRVLMIYYEHWGREDARLRKNQDGLRQFHTLVQLRYGNRRETAWEVLSDTHMSSMRFWRSMADCLLPHMDHWEEYNDYTTKPLYRKIQFAEKMGTFFYKIAHVDDATRKQVDALVALPPCRL